MAAVAHGWKKPGGGGPPASVAKEFNRADVQKRQARRLRAKPEKGETMAHERSETPAYERTERD
jgi:hypothetical protein